MIEYMVDSSPEQLDRLSVQLKETRKAIIRSGENFQLDESSKEAVAASVDALQYLTGGELWNNRRLLEVGLAPSKNYPSGTHITFLPYPESNDKSWKFTMTMTNGVDSPQNAGYLQAEGNSEYGRTVSTYVSVVPTNMSSAQVLGGLLLVASQALSNKIPIPS